MFETLFQEIDLKFPGKIFLSLDEVADLLSCPKEVVYNWTRRADNSKRPPQIQAGRLIRFPKKALVEWLVKEGMA